MNQASNVRHYQIVQRTDETARLELKGLAVKEKEFVVSNIVTTPAWDALIAGLPENDARKKFAWQIENSKTEQDILDYFAAHLLNDVHVIDLVEDIFLNTAVA